MTKTMEVIVALRFRTLALQGSPLAPQYIVTIPRFMNNSG